MTKSYELYEGIISALTYILNLNITSKGDVVFKIVNILKDSDMSESDLISVRKMIDLLTQEILDMSEINRSLMEIVDVKFLSSFLDYVQTECLYKHCPR